MFAAVFASAVTAAAVGGGELDRSFGERGFAVVDGVTSCLTGEGGCVVGIGLAIQRDGAAVLAAGTLEPDCRSRFAIVRFRAGKLDQKFGTAGRVLTSFGSSAAVANAVALTADGRIVVAGERQPPTHSCGHIHLDVGDGFALARYHRDGTPDSTFGEDGKTFTPLPGCDSSGPCRGGAGVTDVLLQRDGKIVAVGSTRGNAALARYTRTGQLDRSFGNQGFVVKGTGNRGPGEVGRPALDRVGRVIVPLSPGCWPCAASVVRYTRDGKLDRTFGDGGSARLPLVSARAVEPTRRGIFVIGIERERVAVVHLSPTGRLIRGFGQDGIAFAGVPARSWVYDTTTDANGKLVILATRIALVSEPPQPWNYTLTRLMPNGSPDRTFGRNGIATVELGEGGSGRRVAIQRDGKIVVASMPGMSRPALTLTRHLR